MFMILKVQFKESFSEGDFGIARQDLNFVRNPRRYGKDIYLLYILFMIVIFSSLYLLYFTNSFVKLPYNEIQKALSFCGLTEEELKEVPNNLSQLSKFQYYIEKPHIGKYIAVALSLLFVAWLWKKLSSTGEIDMFPPVSVKLLLVILSAVYT